MGNELTTITIHGTELPIKEYQGERVVTLKEIDAVHRRPEGTARKRFNDNRKHFIKGVDFFQVCASEIRTHKLMDISPKTHENVALITESGYLMLVKSFTDDLAWDVQRQLVNSYFRVRQEQRQTVELGKIMEQMVIVTSTLVQALSLFTEVLQKQESSTIPPDGMPESQSVRNFVEGCRHPAMRNIMSSLLAGTEAAEYSSKKLRMPRDISLDNGCFGKCKLETFPEEIRTQVDQMMGDMVQQNALNYSMIARFCTFNGYPIASPAVKTYFLRHFSED